VELGQHNLDFRVRMTKSRNGVWHDRVGSDAPAANNQAADFSSIGALSGACSICGCVQYAANALKEGSARCRQLHLAIVSRKQFDPDFALEPPNLMTEVWLRYPKPGGGSSEVELLGDRDKELQMSIFHAPMICKTSKYSKNYVLDISVYQGYFPNIDANLLIDCKASP
jgi:hypothetical protein